MLDIFVYTLLNSGFSVGWTECISELCITSGCKFGNNVIFMLNKVRPISGGYGLIKKAI